MSFILWSPQFHYGIGRVAGREMTLRLESQHLVSPTLCRKPTCICRARMYIVVLDRSPIGHATEDLYVEMTSLNL